MVHIYCIRYDRFDVPFNTAGSLDWKHLSYYTLNRSRLNGVPIAGYDQQRTESKAPVVIVDNSVLLYFLLWLGTGWIWHQINYNDTTQNLFIVGNTVL